MDDEQKSMSIIVRLATNAVGLGLAAISAPISAQQDQVVAPVAPPPAAPGLTFAFAELVTLAPAIHVEPTALGGRNIIPITGGTFAGPELRGTIIPGGWDWQLRRADGCTEIKADYMLRTDDGAVINVVNRGVSCHPKDAAPPSIRTEAIFEAPLGKYEWLSRSAFIGTLEPTRIDGQPAVKIGFFRVD